MSDQYVDHDYDPSDDLDFGVARVSAMSNYIAQFLAWEGWGVESDSSADSLSRITIDLLDNQVNWHMANDDGEVARIEAMLVGVDDERWRPDSRIIATALWLRTKNRSGTNAEVQERISVVGRLLSRRIVRLHDDDYGAARYLFEVATGQST